MLYDHQHVVGLFSQSVLVLNELSPVESWKMAYDPVFGYHSRNLNQNAVNAVLTSHDRRVLAKATSQENHCP